MADVSQDGAVADETNLVMDLTMRGLPIARGFDRNGDHWSIGDTNYPEGRAVWLGRRDGRALLTQAMAAELIPLLCRFVATGSIAEAVTWEDA
ncbi:hypothetical protein E5673_08970 [Sphingomonas sp. PAMC26645]|uniref:hypothetical protein n=1 Tax=Sphingomonas sp. PAMC26645 TaxID=2565555 RepID=UPI00109DE8EA|nr:hypothetical protein [Sphingomonas sp. PAMC26645]QCB42346.1 hypothetical protein E5673_08970 [Sphingomonas sp. PAMC26645]